MTTTENPAPSTSAPARTLSILSLVAAVASVPLGHIVVLPIAAIILGFIAREREPEARTLANWGIGVGFVLLFGWIAIWAVAAAFWLPFALLHFSFWPL